MSFYGQQTKLTHHTVMIKLLENLKGIDKNDALPEIVGHLAGTCYDENIIMDYGMNYIKVDIIHMSL